MFFEVLFFRSALQKQHVRVHAAEMAYGSSTLLGDSRCVPLVVSRIFIRHCVFFTEPVLYLVTHAHSLDEFSRSAYGVYLPTVIQAALPYLLERRSYPQIWYISCYGLSSALHGFSVSHFRRE